MRYEVIDEELAKAMKDILDKQYKRNISESIKRGIQKARLNK